MFFEQYKLAVEMADRISARRATANSFFATINTALATIYVSRFLPQKPASKDDAAAVIIALVGVVLAGTWWLLLRSYRDIAAAKWQVICEMEKTLPAKPFSDEWECLKTDPVKPWRGRYAEFNTLERAVPAAFALAYLTIMVVVIVRG